MEMSGFAQTPSPPTSPQLGRSALTRPGTAWPPAVKTGQSRSGRKGKRASGGVPALCPGTMRGRSTTWTGVIKRDSWPLQEATMPSASLGRSRGHPEGRPTLPWFSPMRKRTRRTSTAWPGTQSRKDSSSPLVETTGRSSCGKCRRRWMMIDVASSAGILHSTNSHILETS